MKIQYKRNLFQQLWNISIKSAFVISLPLLISISFLIWKSISSYNNHLKIINDKSFIGSIIDWTKLTPNLNYSILHFYLNNELKTLRNHHKTTQIPHQTDIQSFELLINSKYLRQLNSNLPKSGKENSYPAVLKIGDKIYSVNARYRGNGYWHWNYKQKSWRIIFDKNTLFNKSLKINLINPESILGFNEVVSLDFARQAGLMVSDCVPVKFFQNTDFMGFYIMLEQVDEFMLRKQKKICGNIYSGDGAPLDKTTQECMLWFNPDYWIQDYSPFGNIDNNREDINFFIQSINNNNLLKFFQFAKKHIDLDNYFSYLAFDSIVGCANHPYTENHKFYCDPVKGTFVAIPWDIAGWTYPVLPNHKYDPSSNELLNKFKMIPEFEFKRQTRVWKLINAELCTENIHDRLKSIYDKVHKIIRLDKYKDANNSSCFNILKMPLLPVRPYNMDEFEKEYREYINIIESRNEYIKNYLSNIVLQFTLHNMLSCYRLDFYISGNTAVKINKFIFENAAKTNLIYKDINRNGILDNDDKKIGCLKNLKHEFIFPGFKFEKNNLPNYQYGVFDLVPSPLLYTYFFVGAKIEDIKIEAQNAVTGENVNVSKVDNIDLSLVKQTDSLHPWDIPAKPKPDEKIIGPGKININETKIYPDNLTVKIMPGTKFNVTSGTSLIFRGKVVAKGSDDNPITFSCSEQNKYWNTFALQGKKTSGSIFKHCIWKNGSIDKVDLIYYPAMVCIHDTDNIVFKNCVFSNNKDNSSGIRIGYGKQISFHQCRFEDLKGNAVSVDISDTNIFSSKFNNNIGNGINIMNSTSRIEDTFFNEIKTSAIFSREDSIAKINRCNFTSSNICIEAQDASQIDITDVSFNKSINAIKTSKGIYPETPTITSNEIFVSSCRKTLLNETNADIDIKKITDNSKNSIFKDN